MMVDLDSIIEDLSTAAEHATKRGHEDIAELIEKQIAQVKRLLDWDQACHIVFNHPDYVIGNLLGRQHLEDAEYDTSQIPNKIGEWGAESIAEVMWDIVANEVPLKEDEA